jgi:hypothetical protein
MKWLFFYCVSVSLLQIGVAVPASGQSSDVPKSVGNEHTAEHFMPEKVAGIVVCLLTLTLADLTKFRRRIWLCRCDGDTISSLLARASRIAKSRVKKLTRLGFWCRNYVLAPKLTFLLGRVGAARGRCGLRGVSRGATTASFVLGG